MYGSAGHSVQVYIFLLKERKKKKKPMKKLSVTSNYNLT